MTRLWNSCQHFVKMKANALRCVDGNRMKFTRTLSLISAALFSFTFSSCGTAYHAEWSAARDKAQSPGNIEGAWLGLWQSSVNGHSGKLWCLIKDGPSNERTFAYRATWGRVFSGEFSATHHLHRSGDQTTFIVDQPLGRLGKFHGEGTIVADKFSACYQAVGDRGTFELMRPPPSH